MGGNGTTSWKSTIAPGMDGLGEYPNGGPYTITDVIFLSEWYNYEDPRYDTAVAVVQDHPTFVGIGWMGLCSTTGSGIEDESMKLYAYPRENCEHSPNGEDEPCGGFMYRDIATITDDCDILESSTTELMYTCDTMHGMSGGGVWRSENNCVYGTHNRWKIDTYGNYNRAHRFTSAWVSYIRNDVICNWPSAYASYPAC